MRFSLTHARVLGALWAVALVAGLVGVGIRLATGEEQAAFGSYIPWGLWVALYAYLGGLSAGAFLLFAVGELTVDECADPFRRKLPLETSVDRLVERDALADLPKRTGEGAVGLRRPVTGNVGARPVHAHEGKRQPHPRWRSHRFREYEPEFFQSCFDFHRAISACGGKDPPRV